MKDRARKSGQVVLVLAFMLLGLLLLALVGVDAFLASHQRSERDLKILTIRSIQWS